MARFQIRWAEWGIFFLAACGNYVEKDIQEAAAPKTGDDLKPKPTPLPTTLSLVPGECDSDLELESQPGQGPLKNSTHLLKTQLGGSCVGLQSFELQLDVPPAFQLLIPAKCELQSSGIYTLLCTLEGWKVPLNGTVEIPIKMAIVQSGEPSSPKAKLKFLDSPKTSPEN